MTQTLTRAFDRFRLAAATLEEEHTVLAARLGSLEREVGDAHRRLAAVLDVVDAGVAVVTPQGRLLRTNRAFDALSCGREGEMLTVPALAGLLRSSGDQPATARARHRSRDLAATLVPVGDQRGTRVLTIRDVTDIRREEREGGRVQRLEALGRMAAELAHEVRNPLGSIRLFASMLHDDAEGRAESREMTRQILNAVSGLETIVSNLLSFARPRGGTLRSVDLAATADEVCRLFAPSCAAREVELVGPTVTADCTVRTDGESPRQVLLNLLGNALAATGPGDRIAVELAPDPKRVLVRVEDSGFGIDPEDLPLVFDPFFSRSEDGSGLGLSIVHRIVERHGGRVSLESKVGQGTLALVEWPRGEAHDA